eukprot:1161267-Pelagomonas_calceolata.AAC.2
MKASEGAYEALLDLIKCSSYVLITASEGAYEALRDLMLITCSTFALITASEGAYLASAEECSPTPVNPPTRVANQGQHLRISESSQCTMFVWNVAYWRGLENAKVLV